MTYKLQPIYQVPGTISEVASFRCVECSHTFESGDLGATCELCGSAVLITGRTAPSVTRGTLEDLAPGVWRYRDFLPEVSSDDVVTLGEGGTPLLPANRLGDELGLRRLLVKDESRNPTGSFLDRGSTVLLSIAKGRGITECSCDTTGNLGASIAAYCAKANLRSRVMVHPNTDQGKLYQMLAYGADVRLSQRRPATHHLGRGSLDVTAGNPYLLEGEMTTGLEVVQDLGWKLPDVIVVPMGTGGHLLMIWQAILLMRDAGLAEGSECRLLGVQVEGASPGAPTPRGRMAIQRMELPLAELGESEPLFKKEASAAIAKSRGAALFVRPDSILAATGLLARTEGIFAEPSSASVVAALSEALDSGHIRRNETIVFVITGAGLKDPKAVSRLAKEARREQFREPYALPLPQIGETKFVLLRILQGQPGYGYDLRRQLGAQRRISTASVYQHLAELESLSMVRRRGVAVAGGRERILYELTRRGNDYLSIAGRLQRADRVQSRRGGPRRRTTTRR